MHAHIVVAVKLVVAVGALTALTSIPAKLLWPALSLLQLAALLVAALVVLVVLSVCLLQFYQLLLRNGATDTQWFWFRSEPPGLEQQRRAAERHGQ